MESDWVDEYYAGYAAEHKKGGETDDWRRGYEDARKGLDAVPVRGRECGLCSQTMTEVGCQSCDKALTYCA